MTVKFVGHSIFNDKFYLDQQSLTHFDVTRRLLNKVSLPLQCVLTKLEMNLSQKKNALEHLDDYFAETVNEVKNLCGKKKLCRKEVGCVSQ